MKLKIAGAAQASRFKQQRGIPCEDAVFKRVAHGIHCMVLCDGAGSKKYAATGARTAARTAALYITANFAELATAIDLGRVSEVAKSLIDQIISDLKHKRFARLTGVQEYASTLLFAATDKKRVIVGQLGDGGIGLITDNARLAFQIPKGEFANQTYFTTSPSSAEHLQLALLPITDLRGIIIFSDGTAQSLIENKSNTFGSAAATMVGWLQSNSATVVQEALSKNLKEHFVMRTHDDCSISIMSLS